MRRKLAGFALLLSVVMLGAFISGCINQSMQTETTRGSTETTTKEPPETRIDAEIKEVEEAIGLLSGAIGSMQEQEPFSSFTVVKVGIPKGEERFQRLMELAGSEENRTKKLEYLSSAYLIRFAQMVELRNALITAAVEGAYWDRVRGGEGINGFYNENGIFLVDGRRVSAGEMALATLRAVEGREIVGIEIYHPGSGLRFADTRGLPQEWKISHQKPLKILIPEGKVVKFKAGAELSKAVNRALPTGKVVVKDIKRGNIVSESSYGKPQGMKLSAGVYAIYGTGCLAVNVRRDGIPPGGSSIVITPYNPFTACSYPVNGTLFVAGDHSEARELSPEELARIQREIPEAKGYSRAIRIPVGEYTITTMGFGLAVIDAERGKIIGEASLQGSDVRKDITIDPVSGDLFLAVAGESPEAPRAGCWLARTDENGNVILDIKEKCSSPVLLRVSPESSVDAPVIERIPLEDVDVFVGVGNISVTRMIINEGYRGKRYVRRISVDIEGLNESADALPFMKLKNVLDPRSAIDMFIKLDGIDGESNSTPWGFPLTVNETTAYPGPYGPFLAGILEPLSLDASFIPSGIGRAKLKEFPIPSAVGERISQPEYGTSDTEQIPFVIITGGDGVENGIPEYTMEIPLYSKNQTPGTFIIEVLTLRDPATGEESMVVLTKLIGGDGRLEFMSKISRVEGIVVLEGP